MVISSEAKMADDKKYGSLDDFAKEVWGKRAEGLPVIGLDIDRPIAPTDIDFIKKRYAFIQIINPDATEEESFDSIKIIKAKSGWTILHYGTAISSSPGDTLFGVSDKYRLDENGNYTPVNTGKGTRIKQIIDTAVEIIRLTQKSSDDTGDEGGSGKEVKKSWPSIYIVSGQDDFIWAIWAAAQEYKLEVQGYTPSKQDIAKYERIKSIFKSITHPVKQPTP